MEIPTERASMHQRVVLVGAVGLAVVALTLWLLGSRAPVDRIAKTAKVEAAATTATINAFGVLVPEKVQSLIAMTEGRVLSVQQRAGALVTKGQTIVQLVNPKLQRVFEEQQLALQAQQAEYLLVQQQLQQEQLQLSHDLKLAKAERDLLQTQLTAKQALFQRQIISALDFAQSQALLAQAQQKVELADEKLSGFSASSQSRLRAALLNQQRTEKMRDIAGQDIQALQIQADLAGQLVMLDESLKAGSQVVAGQAIGQVAEPGLLVAELKVAAMDAAQIKTGLPVLLNIKGKTMSGLVSWLSPNIVDNFLRVDVTLQGDLPDTARAYIEVRGDIQVASDSKGLVVARADYIAKRGANQSLFVWDDASQRFVRTSVDIQQLTAEQMVLGQGIAVGAEVLLQVPSSLLQADSIALEDVHG